MNDRVLIGLATTGHRGMRKTDRTVQAEVKNKLEQVKLTLKQNVFDRQQMKARFFIDKEKRLSTNAMKTMQVTTGLSIEGQPGSRTDPDYVKSDYFHDKSALRETAVRKWRASEKELRKEFLGKDMKLLKLPWEKDPFENLALTFNQMMRLLGYDTDDVMTRRSEEDEDEKEEDWRGRWRKMMQPRPPSTCKANVFECLHRGEEGALPKRFSVAKWETRAMKDYTKVVAKGANNEKAFDVQESDDLAMPEKKMFVTPSIRPHTAGVIHPHRGRSNRTRKRPMSAIESVHFQNVNHTITSNKATQDSVPPTNNSQYDSCYGSPEHSSTKPPNKPLKRIPISAILEEHRKAKQKEADGMKMEGELPCDEEKKEKKDEIELSYEEIQANAEDMSAYYELRQWKRELLMEAPACVFTPRVPVKVPLVMSKGQRKRELEHLKDEAAKDTRGIVMAEDRRKTKARVGLLKTLQHLENTLGMETDLTLFKNSQKSEKTAGKS